MENQNIKYKDVPLIKEIEKCNDNIFYYGEGGIGKTTQMQLAFNYFSSKCTNTVPVFLDADKEIDFRKADPLMSAIACKYLGSDIETDDIWKLFTNNSPSSAKNYTYIIFVDGINELTQNNKGYLIEKITHIIDESKNTRFIISSRIKENLGLRFKNIAIKPLEKKDILKYLGENYGANDNSKNINDSLVEILQIPLYLSVFKNTYNSSDYKPNIYDESTVRKADILDSYIQKILHEKRETNAADTALFEFIVKYFLPALAFEMVKENVHVISITEYRKLRDNTNYFEIFCYDENAIDIFKQNSRKAHNYIVENFALLESRNDVYTFTHQIWRDYFCAKHIINCLNVTSSEQIQNDLEIPVDNEIKGFVGQLIYTYDEKFHYSKEEHFPPKKSDRMCECDFEAKDNLEDWDESPIEHYMQQHNLEQEEQNQISPLVTRNLIEIMKASRNNHITSNFNYLDLRQSILFGESHFLKNSSFRFSKIIKDTFLPKITSNILSIASTKDNERTAYLTVHNLEFIIVIISDNDNSVSRIPKEIVNSPDFVGDFTMNFYNKDIIGINIGCTNKCLVYNDYNGKFNIIDSQSNYDKNRNIVADFINNINKDNQFNIIDSQIYNDKNSNISLDIIKETNKTGRKYIFLDGHKIEITKHNILLDKKACFTVDKAEFLQCSFDYNNNQMAVSTNNGEVCLLNYDQYNQNLTMFKKIYSDYKYIFALDLSDDGILSYYDGFNIVTYRLIDKDIEYISKIAAYYIDRNFTISFDGSFSIIGSRIWKDELYVEVKNIDEQTVDSAFIDNYEKVCFGAFNGCFSLIRNHHIEIWSVIDYKLSLIKKVDLSTYEINYKEISISFTESDESVQLQQGEKTVLTINVNFIHSKFLSKQGYNTYLHQNKAPIIYANIINCDFRESIFCEEFNIHKCELSFVLKIALKQSGAIISVDEYLPSGISGMYYEEKINISGLMIQMQKKHCTNLEKKILSLFSKYFISMLNLNYIKDQELYEKVDYLFNNLTDFIIIRMNEIINTDNSFEKVNSIFTYITTILTNCQLHPNEDNYGLQATLISLIVQKICLGRNPPKHRVQYVPISNQINLQLLSSFDYFVYPINLMMQLFLVFHINCQELICGVYKDGFSNHLNRILKINKIQTSIHQFNSLFNIWQNRTEIQEYSICELELLERYEKTLKEIADVSLTDNNHYLAFLALTPKPVEDIQEHNE